LHKISRKINDSKKLKHFVKKTQGFGEKTQPIGVKGLSKTPKSRSKNKPGIRGDKSSAKVLFEHPSTTLVYTKT
jgi:hypothetical protein